MENMDKPQRSKQVNLCPNCGEEYSVTYKRCPFCGGSADKARSGIDIQGPELYDQPPVIVRPSVPNPSAAPSAVAVLDDFVLDSDVDFTPELEDETSSVPKPPPGSTGGKRLAAKGGRPPSAAPAPRARTKGSSGGLRVFLTILSLLIIAAAAYIVVTRAVPIIQTYLENRKSGIVDPNANGEDDPVVNEPNFTLTEVDITLTAPGATKQLIPIFEPPELVGTLTWISEDPSIVDVSEEGRLTAVAPGSTTVSVFREDDTKATCKVDCVWNDETILENLSLNKSEFALYSSDPPVQMKVVGVEGTPPEIVWESQDPTIVTVSEAGLVKWVASGNTKIICTINGTLVLECKVYSH